MLSSRFDGEDVKLAWNGDDREGSCRVAQGEIEADADRLRAVITLFRRHLRRSDSGDLSVSQVAAVVRLSRVHGMTSADLARAEGVSPQSMATTVASLIALNLIERRPDPHDGRRKLLGVTDDGRRVLRHREDVRADRLRDAIRSELTAAEIRELHGALSLLERVARRVNAVTIER